MKIVVVGGGFGGVKTAIELARRNVGSITLVSEERMLTDQSTIRKVASGGDAEQMAIPLKEIFTNYPSVAVKHDSSVKINATSKKLICKKKSYDYDALVLDLGQINQFGGANARKQRSYAASSMESAKVFRDDFHDMITEDDRKEFHCAIIGGGQAGVELAGALREYATKIEQAHQLKHIKTRISLAEATKRLLPDLSASARRKVSARLSRAGVDTYVNTPVDGASSRTKLVLGGKALPIDIAIRTDGSANHRLFQEHPTLFKLTKNGKIVVNQYMAAYPDIYVINSNVNARLGDEPAISMREGLFIARHLQRLEQGKTLKVKSQARDQIVSVAVSRFWAYVEFGGVYVAGRTGSMVCRLVELNNYCHFLPLSVAYKYWRKYRKSALRCELCTGA